MLLYITLISVIIVITMLILHRMITQNYMLSSKTRLFFRLAALSIALVTATELATLYLNDADIRLRGLHFAAIIIGFSIAPGIPVMLGYGIGDFKHKTLNLLLIPIVLNAVFIVLSAKFGWIYSISSTNSYSRGDFFGIFILAYISGLAFLFFQALISSRIYQIKDFFTLSMLFLFLSLATLIQVFFPDLPLSWLCVSSAMALYYAYYSALSQQMDGLTPLLNRYAYENQIARINGRKNVSILFFDVDAFKNINDSYGHPFGDYCLQTVASCIFESFSKVGLCYRIGGDEFCVISDQTDVHALQKEKDDFLHQMDRAREKEPRLPMVSFGHTMYDAREESVHQAILKADLQMYQFKEQRKAERLNISQ